MNTYLPLLNGLQNYKIHVVFLRFFHITLLEIAQIHSLCFILANKDGRTLCPCCPFPFRFPPLATAFSHLHSGPVRFSLSLRRLPLPPPCSVFPGVRYFYPASCVIPFSKHSVFPFQSPDSLFAHREKAPRRFFPKQGRRITLRHQFSKERTVPSRSLSFCLHAALSFILFYPC